MQRISRSNRDDWKNWIKKDQDLRTQTRRSLLRVSNVTDDNIEILAKNNRQVRLNYDYLDVLWKQRELVEAEITKPRGKGKISLNTMANRVWEESGLAKDPTNESYYWAVICERIRGEAGLLGLTLTTRPLKETPRLVQHLRTRTE